MRKVQMSSVSKVSIAALALAAGLATPAFAQGHAAGASGAGDDDAIVVTATRRATDLQSTPVAVTAITGEQVERLRIQGLEGALAMVPNANILDSSGASGTFTVIRGASSTDDAPAVDLPVSYFIDEVYSGSAASAYPDFYDVQQIEVLRGPQGTTFGRNVTGGAVVVSSKKPTFDTEGQLSATVGNYERYEAKGFISGALLEDKIAGRLAFSTRDYAGHGKNTTTGNHFGGADFTSGRASVLFTPDEKTDILMIGNYTRDKSSGLARSTYLIGDGPSLPGFAGANALPTDPDETRSAVDFRNDGESWGAIVRIDHDFDFATLTSISAVRNLDMSYTHSGDASAASFSSPQIDSQKEEQVTQEFRLASDGNGGPFSWVAGLFFLNTDAARNERYTISPVPGTAIYAAQSFTTLQNNTQISETESSAVFFEGVYDLTEKLAVRGGVRYTKDKKTGRTIHEGDANVFTGALFDAPFGDKWSATTYRVGLEYQATDDVFLYASASSGFKSGGFSLNNNTPVSAATSLNPEEVWNYEAGARTTWFDDRLKANVTLFQQDTTDLQTRVFVNAIAVVANAGESRSRGVELDLQFAATDNFDFGVTYGFLDAKFEDFPGCARVSGVDINCAGKQLAFVPETTANIYANFSQPLKGGELFGRLETRYKSEIEFENVNTFPRDLIAKTELNWAVDGQVGWASPNDDWRFTLWGKNLFDERAITNAIDMGVLYLAPSESAAGERAFIVTYNQPRTFGVTLARNF